MAAAILVGPKLEMVNSFTNAFGAYLNNFIQDSLGLNTYGDNSWVENWRIFYWAWWIAWAPFVGIFISRISKDRTIREFIAGVVAFPFIFIMLFTCLALVKALKEENC